MLNHLLRAQGGGRRSVQAQLGDDERKASVVHGLLIHALREREELAGKPSPLPDILDQLPVESRAKIPARAPGVIKAAGVAHVGLIAGQTGPVCARLEAGAPFARLATSPVRALSARAELQVGPTADGPWMPVWESSRSVAGSELAQALDSATGEVRRVILSAHVEGDEFIVSWEADAAYGATLPGGVLTTFNVSDLVARSRGQA